MNVSGSENINFQTPNPENIFTLSEATGISSRVSSGKTTQKNDSEKSRDPLFKSFVFEQNKCDRETEKCIAFWKSVMDKNLKPIKCSIIESKNQYSKQLNDEEISAKCREEVEKAIQAIHIKYRNLWSDMVKEAQKKKLNEVKLIGKTKCILCDTLASHEGCLCKAPKNEVNKEIKKLNGWKSASVPLRKDEIKLDPVKIARQKAVIDKSYDRKYKFVDVRNEKKKSKLYENWRRHPDCKCFINDCTCPAVKSSLSIADVPILESKTPSLVEVSIQNLDVKHESELLSHIMIPSQLRYQSKSQFEDSSSKPAISSDERCLMSSSHVENENVNMSHFAVKMMESNKYSETELLALKSPDKKIETEETKTEGLLEIVKNNIEHNSKQGYNPTVLIPLEELLHDSDTEDSRGPSVIESNVRLYLGKGNNSNKSLNARRGVSILKYTGFEHNVDHLDELQNQEQQKSTPPDYSIVIKRDSLEMARQRIHSIQEEKIDIHKIQDSKIKRN